MPPGCREFARKMFRPSEMRNSSRRGTGCRRRSDRHAYKSAFPNLYEAVFSSCSARSQSCSGEPSGQPRSAQYFSARRAISSREGAAAGVCFLAAGFRRLAVPFAASALLVVICVSLIQPHLFAHQSIQGHLHDTEEREQLSAGQVVTLGLPWLESRWPNGTLWQAGQAGFISWVNTTLSKIESRRDG
jgi:hypothetical protein